MGQPTTGRGRKGKMALGQSLRKNMSFKNKSEGFKNNSGVKVYSHCSVCFSLIPCV